MGWYWKRGLSWERGDYPEREGVRCSWERGGGPGSEGVVLGESGLSLERGGCPGREMVVLGESGCPGGEGVSLLVDTCAMCYVLCTNISSALSLSC